jgi:hypothetical protein
VTWNLQRHPKSFFDLPDRNSLFHKWFVEFEREFPSEISRYNTEVCNPDGDCAKLIMLIPNLCACHTQIKEAFLSIDNNLKAKGY